MGSHLCALGTWSSPWQTRWTKQILPVRGPHCSSLGFRGKGSQGGYTEQGCETGIFRLWSNLYFFYLFFFNQNTLLTFHLCITESCELTAKKHNMSPLIHMLFTLDCQLVAIQKSREANRDLQIQLDQVLQQAQDPNSKGNSLFAEVIFQFRIKSCKSNCACVCVYWLPTVIRWTTTKFH